MESDRKRKLSAIIDTINSSTVPERNQQQLSPSVEKRRQQLKRTSAQLDLSEEAWTYKLRLRANIERAEESGKGRYWCEAFISFRARAVPTGTATHTPPPPPPPSGSSYTTFTAIPVQFSLDVDARKLVEMITCDPSSLCVSLDTKDKVVFVDLAPAKDKK